MSPLITRSAAPGRSSSRAARTGAPPRGILARLRLALSSVIAAVLGVAPHVLHHAGPLAGAALFAGLGGTVLFGALGFVAAAPMLLRMRRRTGSWRAPAALLALFATVFAISSFVVGPAIAGDDDREGRQAPAPTRAPPAEHDGHH